MEAIPKSEEKELIRQNMRKNSSILASTQLNYSSQRHFDVGSLRMA